MPYNFLHENEAHFVSRVFYRVTLVGIRRIFKICKRVWKIRASLSDLSDSLFLLSHFLLSLRREGYKNTVVHSVGIPPPS